jgi:probable HAF family extracellular repeat protein
MKNDRFMRNENAITQNRTGKLLCEAWRAMGFIWAICFVSAAVAQNRYQITRIPTAQGTNSVALAINNGGSVAGYSFRGEDYQAFLYSSSDQLLTAVGSLGGKINAACAVNDAGQVTGYSQDGNGNLLAFIFSRNQPIKSLGTLASGSMSEAFGINNNGVVVGDSQSDTQNHRPVVFSKTRFKILALAVQTGQRLLKLPMVLTTPVRSLAGTAPGIMCSAPLCFLMVIRPIWGR